MAVMHLHIKFGADIFIQSRVIDIFPKFKMPKININVDMDSHSEVNVAHGTIPH